MAAKKSSFAGQSQQSYEFSGCSIKSKMCVYRVFKICGDRKEKNKRSIMERWVKRMSQVVKDEETNLSYK